MHIIDNSRYQCKKLKYFEIYYVLTFHSWFHLEGTENQLKSFYGIFSCRNNEKSLQVHYNVKRLMIGEREPKN
ncbi:hypothetical protein EUGRSUZ_E02598 [Eucalyptus grandis]|uniref:Uncharacterized protein n=2 Tax=Eucalyptus grandis TaxID=71139 RepID=A0ACC3KXB7_EUCGR|nr:hypothetical protein EUGRSUZ_E02598 [Eucalyptus grandis]